MSQELLNVVARIDEILSTQTGQYLSLQRQDLETFVRTASELERRLEEAEQAISAISNGEVDALVRSNEKGTRIYTLEGPDEPYRNIVETMNAGAVTINRDGIISYSNSLFSDMTGIPLHLLIGSFLTDLVVSEDVPLFLNFFERTRRGEKTSEEIRIKSGAEKLFVRLAGSSQISDQMEKTSLVITDISHLKSVEESLLKARNGLEARVEQRTAQLAQEKEALADEILHRKRTEKALRESEARLRTSEETLRLAIDSTGLGVWDYYPQTGRLHWSENVKRHFVLPLESPVDFDVFLSRIHAEDRDKVLEYTNLVLSPGGVRRKYFEYRTIAFKDGKTRWLAVWVQAHLNEAGMPVRLIGTTLDITERRRAEEALRQSEERFRVAQDLSPDGFTILRPFRDTSGEIIDFTWVYENQAIARLNGTDPKAVVDRRLSEFLPGHGATPFHDLYKRVAQTGKPEVMESLYRGDSIPHPTWFRVAVVSMGDDIAVMAEDITERKKIEEELRASRDELEQRVKERTAELEASQERYRDLAELLPETIFETDISGRFSYVNRHALRSFGYTPEDVERGVHIRDVVAEEHYQAAKERVATILKGEGPQSAEFTLMRKDGSEFPALIRASRIEHKNEIQGLRGVITDLTESLKKETERRQLEEQLRQAQKMEAVGTLAGGIAHDFNNMLAVIMGNAELALDDLNDNEAPKHNVEQIIKASKRARDLVRQILTFSRKTETGRKPLQLTPLVKETFKLLRGSLPSTIQMDLVTDIESDTVVADASQIQQVIMNLSTNAAYAMRETGGALTIRVGEVNLSNEILPDSDLEPGRYIRLQVKDAGTGMDRQVIDRIFEPFFTTKEAGQGTGMGLAVVYGILKKHKGAITAESEPGKGSLFTVFLPKAREKASQEPKEAGDVPFGRESILLVDDEPTVVDMTSRLLERLGYKVTGVDNPADALRLFEDDPHRFDLVITDQTMPHMTGLTLADIMFKQRKDIPIVLFTGYSELVSPEKAKQHGISEFVMKPVVKHEIAGTIRRVLDQRKGPPAGV